VSTIETVAIEAIAKPIASKSTISKAITSISESITKSKRFWGPL